VLVAIVLVGRERFGAWARSIGARGRGRGA
jgi:Sec-independent protein translocase protein TatA